MRTLYSFDFDGTLCHTPEPVNGKKIWEEKTGISWPYTGWWGKAESINTDIFYVPVNGWVYKRYLEASLDESGIKILATGRLNKVENMRKNVEEILRINNLTFDEILVIPSKGRYPENGEGGIYLNWGGDTFNFKIRLFESLIDKTKCDRFIMYDDRYEHLTRFKEWARDNKKCEIVVVDVINKRERTFKL